MCGRVAGLMPVSLQEEVRDAIQNKLFLPGTPILRNANARGSLNMLSCHNIQVGNSIREIWAASGHAAQLLKSGGGGVGVEFSKLSPRGTKLKYIGKSHAAEAGAGGPTSFVELFILTGRLIGTARSGKPSGMMCLLRADHEDVLEWITAKDDDGVYHLCNMSVSFDAGPDEVRPDIWGRIVKQAWKNGTPGVVFLDNVNHRNPVIDEYGPIETMNVCLGGDATVLTPSGIRVMDDIDAGSTIWGKDGWVTVSKKWRTGFRDVYRVITSRGEFIGTLDHRVFEDGERVEVGVSQSIDQCRVLGVEVDRKSFNVQDIMDGLVIGDGSRRRYGKRRVYLWVGDKDQDYFRSPIAGLIVRPRCELNGSYYVDTTVQPSELPPLPLRTIPNRFFYGDSCTKAGFLRGLFSANGCVVSTASRVSLRQTSERMIKQAQMMLSSLGIDSYVTISKERMTKFRNGRYLVKESYDLNITTDAELFMEMIGFEQQYKMDSFVPRGGSNRRIGGIVQGKEYLGRLPVYDITVDHPDHAFWSGGLLVSNCAENPAYSYEGCCLSSIVLPNVVKRLGDWGELKRAAKLQTLLLNRVVDLNHYPLPQFREMAHDLRRIGGGVMGFHTLLKREGIPLYSEEANALGRQLANIIYLVSDRTSWELAEVEGGYRDGRRRNVSLMAIAPNGHGSTLGECTPSIYCDLYNPDDYKTHLEATPEQHINHIAAWQDVVDGGVSYTVSIPHDSKPSRVDEIFRRAHQGGLKAISVYRDSSREGQPCTTEGSCSL